MLNKKSLVKIRVKARRWSWVAMVQDFKLNVGNYALVVSIMCLAFVGILDLTHEYPKNDEDYRTKVNYRIARQAIWEQIEIPPTYSDEPKIILFWTKYYNSSDFHFGLGAHPFANADCSCSNCKLTNDRKLLKHSSAIIFHSGDIDVNDMPPIRYAHQKWIFYNFSPVSQYKPLPAILSNKFNWTMTYRTASDIVHRFPFGRLVKYANSHQQHQLISDQPKKKLIAWMATNCHTSVQREHFVRELSKHIQVDIYGQCGPLHCGSIDQCNKIIQRDYKFVLSLEQTLCSDFVSERFFWVLTSGAVPVVYGKANYGKLAPPHSHINVNDFHSPKQLADYLRFIDSNDRIYNQFFDWKIDYKVERYPTIGWCDLCDKVNNPLLTNTRSFYQDINEWWVEGATCDATYHQKLTKMSSKLNG